MMMFIIIYNSTPSILNNKGGAPFHLTKDVINHGDQLGVI